MAYEYKSDQIKRQRRIIISLIVLLAFSVFFLALTTTALTILVFQTTDVFGEAYYLIGTFSLNICKAENIQQVGSIEGIPIHEYDTCGTELAKYNWDYGIFINRKYLHMKEELIQEELCHARQERPKTKSDWIKNEWECGHVQKMFSVW